jgi:antitoxin PrlF
MKATKVTRNFQVTIPPEARKALHLRMGSLVEFIVEDNLVTLRPKVLIDEDQAWFWSTEWQAGEREVNASVKKGETRTFKNVARLRRHFEK